MHRQSACRCSLPQSLVLGGQRKLQTSCKFQIRRIVNCKAMSLSQFGQSIECRKAHSSVYLDWELTKLFQRLAALGCGQFSSSYQDKQHIRYFKWPECGNMKNSALFDRVKKPLSPIGCLPQVYPCDGHRSINDKGLTHACPSSMAERTSSSDKAASAPISACNSRKPATAAAAWRLSGRPSGMSRATGLSYRVMTTSSPRATRSRSLPKWVLASYADMLLTSVPPG